MRHSAPTIDGDAVKILYSAAGTRVPGVDGGSVHTLELCRALARRQHDVHLAALPPAAPGAVAADDLDGVTLHPLPERRTPRVFEWTAAPAVKRVIADVRPDVVIERFYTFGGAAIWAAKQCGIPSVLEINSPARPYPGSLRDALDRLTVVRPVDRWRRYQLSSVRAIYTTSPRLLPPTWARPVHVIVNGVDTDRFRPGPSIANAAAPLRGVYVSSFRPWHAAEDLIRAVATCRDRGVAIHVRLLGAGPRWQAARRAATALKVDSSAEWLGAVPHAAVPGHLQAADVGLAPFSPEAFSALALGWFWSPIKIFEYLAAGLPVVTADLPELRALLPDEVASFYPAGQPEALADRLAHLASNRAILRRMSRAARDLAERRYTWDAQAQIVERVLTEAAAEPHRFDDDSLKA